MDSPPRRNDFCTRKFSNAQNRQIWFVGNTMSRPPFLRPRSASGQQCDLADWRTHTPALELPRAFPVRRFSCPWRCHICIGFPRWRRATDHILTWRVLATCAPPASLMHFSLGSKARRACGGSLEDHKLVVGGHSVHGWAPKAQPSVASRAR